MSNFYLLQYFNVFLNNNCNKRLSSVNSALLQSLVLLREGVREKKRKNCALLTNPPQTPHSGPIWALMGTYQINIDILCIFNLTFI